jgi:SAM-dependent MidA family methyltransferase
VPARYRILEVSADLRERQRALVATLPARLAARVEWLDAIPDAPFRGVLYANEVLDALPVERFRRTADGVESLGVVVRDGAFAFAARPADQALAAAVREIEADLGARLPDGYVSEACLGLAPWLAAVTAPLAAGVALFMDYGYVRRDYYAPDRDGGTLACHFRQRRHDDPFANPGLQDVTAWVDFTAVAGAALACGLDVAGYTTQAHFLLGTGFDRHVAALAAEAGEAGVLRAHAAARLVLPGEMGERFKCLALAREWHAPLAGFRLRDFTAAL